MVLDYRICKNIGFVLRGKKVVNKIILYKVLK